MINCEEAAKFLNAYLDRELSAEDVRHLEEHLKRCKDCFGHVNFDKALKQLLKNQFLKTQLSPQIKTLLSKKLSTN